MFKGFMRQVLAALSVGLTIVTIHYPLSASGPEEPALPVLQTRAKTVSIFKNGLGFVIRQGDVSLKDGWVVTEHVPRSALGSLWIGSLDKGTSIEEVIGFTEEIERQTEATSIAEMLKANIGRKAKITSGEKMVEGTIKSIPEMKVAEQDDRHEGRIRTPMPYPQPQPAEIVIIGTQDGDVVLNKSHITRIEFPESLSAKFSTRERVKRMKLKVSTEEDKARLFLSYLQKGISWVPSYLVNIEDPKRARITLKATVINDMEDLENVDLFFVVGYPNFLYADLLSPMALEESIRQFMAALEAGSRVSEESKLANIMRQSVSFEREEEIPRLDYGYASLKGLPGAPEEDLFLYSKQGVNLRKGERADYLMFSDEIAYQHIYEWDIPDTLRVDARGHTRSEQDKREKENIWHSIKLSNSTAYPWTAAPAFTISGWKPLAQDMMDYTPKGSQRNLKLTVATDVKHDRREYETERQRDTRLYNRSYDLVTVKGELYIKNHKTKGIRMETKKRLTGEVIETSHDGKVEKRAEGLEGVNQNSLISWEIPVGAGKEVTVTYKYKVYIAR